jgi:hypothetical protein
VNNNSSLHDMVEDAAVESGEVVVLKPKRVYFKWTEYMLLMLVKAVLVNHAAYADTENYETKYGKVILSLWKLKVFSDQGPPLAWGTVKDKFKSTLEAFKKKFGYGDGGDRVNTSALPDIDDLPEIDVLLNEIYRQVAKRAEAADLEKRTKTQKKEAISNITDVLKVGGGKAGLAKLATEMSNTTMLTTSTANFAKGLTGQVNPVTCDAKRKAEKMSQDDMEGENLMASFAKLIKQDDLDYDTRMQRLEAEIRTSGEATRAAIVAGNEQKASTDAAMLASFAVLISLQSKGSSN